MDVIYGGAGNDSLFGDGGNDNLAGGEGSDNLFGGEGNDTLDGFKGDDRGIGGSGRDLARLGLGHDTWFDATESLEGDDTVFGGEGNDTIHLSGGDDIVGGGLGADTFILNPEFEADTILDFEIGVDQLLIHSTLWSGALDQTSLNNVSLLTVDTGTLVLTLGSGNTLLLNGLTSNAGLLDDISLF